MKEDFSKSEMMMIYFQPIREDRDTTIMHVYQLGSDEEQHERVHEVAGRGALDLLAPLE